MTAVVVVLVVLAGGLGAGARYLVDTAVRRRWTLRLPLATTLVNTTGSFVLGLLTGLAADQGVLVAVLGTGFLGGYTTFSTASVEVVSLLREGRRGAAAVHALTVLGGSLLAAAVGLALGSAARE